MRKNERNTVSREPAGMAEHPVVKGREVFLATGWSCSSSNLFWGIGNYGPSALPAAVVLGTSSVASALWRGGSEVWP